MSEKMDAVIQSLKSKGVDLYSNFHALPALQVCAILETAIACGYKAPKNANGSRARYFYAFVQQSIK